MRFVLAAARSVGTRLIYHGKIKDWVDFGVGYISMVIYLGSYGSPSVTHPRRNQ